jgi:2-oxoglutarate ferredoxin oxidoreductase subunit gamma
LINSSLVKEEPTRKGLKIVKVEATGIAEQIGNLVFANMVALGAMVKVTGALNLTDIEGILKKFFPPDKHQFVPMNVQAIQAGYKAV